MSSAPSELIVSTTHNHVTTLRMNNPRRLNGWTAPMLIALKDAMARAAADPETKALILTGTGAYYCAGVNLGAVISPQHPRKVRAFIKNENQSLFEHFIDFPKPILVAVNGPAIGASVTSATLCDAIIASDKATFSTPFAALGVTPEGCSSVHLPRIIGARNTDRMLGPEGWKPTGAEAAEMGMVVRVVPDESLMEEAQKLAESWVAEGKPRSFPKDGTAEELKAINERESEVLADAFLAPPFLWGQFSFLWRKNKRGPAMMFFTLWITRPLWSRML